MDENAPGWLIGDSPERGRTLVVHAAAPRFFVEMTRTSDDTWDVGRVEWLDGEPPDEDAEQWHQDAADVFFAWSESSKRTA